MMVDPWIHDKANPVYSDFGDYICSITDVFTGGECGTEESVVSVSKIRAKAKN